jgi:hypothetical protein
MKRVIQTHFTDLLNGFESFPDNRGRKEYSMKEAIFGALMMHLFRLGSRNAYNNQRCEKIFRKNFYHLFGINLPHADSTDDILRRLPPEHIEELKAHLVGMLIEQKVFRKFRFLGRSYLVALDATGMATFDYRHCDHCLSRESKNGVMTYFHYALEAKLVTSSGFSISLATEFVENLPDRDFDKQDCEQKAFQRLAPRIKKLFPRLPICLLADGLYPNKTIFDICEKYGWQFIITLKDGCLKSFQEEVQLLGNTTRKRCVIRADRNSRTTSEYRYLNQLEYCGKSFSWVECLESVYHLKSKQLQQSRFVYITNVPQSEQTVVETADYGRLRWKIENEGFNTQKNLGFELEHKFSRCSYTAMQNYYRLLQIAHMIVQMVEHSREIIELKNEHSKQTWTDLWKKTVAFLIFFLIEPVDQEYIESG